MADLGTVEFPHLGGKATAILWDDRTWTLDGVSRDLDEMIRTALDDVSRQIHGPQHGFYGPKQLAEAARIMQGTVTAQATILDGPSGRVY